MMHWVLEIRDGNAPVRTMELPPGEYRIGRSPESEIHLDDRSVSKRHATITVAAEGVVTVRDDKSANGTRVNGKPILEKKMSMGCEVRISGFQLSLSPPDIVSGKKRSGFRPDARLVFISSMAVFLSAIILISHLQVSGKLKTFKEKGALSHGKTLVTWLGEMNRPFLAEKNHDRLIMTPVTGEPGVRKAFIVDSSGRILMPLEHFGNYLEMSDLDAILTAGNLVDKRQGNGERLLIYPINGPSYPLGASVIRYRPDEWGRDFPQPGTGGLILMLTISVLFSLAAGRWLYSRMLSPVRLLAEDLDRALAENDTQLQTSSPNTDYSRLWDVAGRLLVRVVYQKTAPPVSLNMKQPEKVPVSMPGMDLARHPHPACRVDTAGYLIEEWNPSFKERFAPEADLSPGTHLIQVIQDPELVNNLFDLLQKGSPEAGAISQTMTAGTFVLELFPANETGAAVILSFQETNDASS